jgi:putative oxidoreductase
MRFSQNNDIALLILRLVFGFAMIYGHGWGKVLRLFGDEPIRFADPFGLGPAASLALAAFAEVLCSILIMIGLFTRWALIPLIFTMLVALFYVHLSDPFDRQEKAILFLAAFVALLVAGPGRYSADQQWRNQAL